MTALTSWRSAPVHVDLLLDIVGDLHGGQHREGLGLHGDEHARRGLGFLGFDCAFALDLVSDDGHGLARARGPAHFAHEVVLELAHGARAHDVMADGAVGHGVLDHHRLVVLEVEIFIFAVRGGESFSQNGKLFPPEKFPRAGETSRQREKHPCRNI